jgi:hypothetical protein
MGSVSALSAGVNTTTLYVMADQAKGGGACTPHPHQPGLTFPSRWNVRHKMAIATLFTLCSGRLKFIESTYILPLSLKDLKLHLDNRVGIVYNCDMKIALSERV